MAASGGAAPEGAEAARQAWVRYFLLTGQVRRAEALGHAHDRAARRIQRRARVFIRRKTVALAAAGAVAGVGAETAVGAAGRAGRASHRSATPRPEVDEAEGGAREGSTVAPPMPRQGSGRQLAPALRAADDVAAITARRMDSAAMLELATRHALAAEAARIACTRAADAARGVLASAESLAAAAQRELGAMHSRPGPAPPEPGAGARGNRPLPPQVPSTLRLAAGLLASHVRAPPFPPLPNAPRASEGEREEDGGRPARAREERGGEAAGAVSPRKAQVPSARG